MTVRMTVALTVLSLGLTVAALAGIPSLIENRLVGDVVMVVGFGAAAVGGVLVATAIPGQRRANKLIAANRLIDVDQLRIERRRLLESKADVLSRLFDVTALHEAAQMANQTTRARIAMHDKRRLELESFNLETDIQKNANEFRRLGMEPSERPEMTNAEKKRLSGVKLTNRRRRNLARDDQRDTGDSTQYHA
ncbi:hypothetical protein [Microbacterium enclense]|uniref:hypothetical protein n=1 Tax=Microbacterium enclense TaxID=993073 RepID=UPI003F803800